MNRKSFFKNLIGAAIATAIGNKLDFIPEVQSKGIILQLEEYEVWINYIEMEFTRQWRADFERQIWFGESSKRDIVYGQKEIL